MFTATAPKLLRGNYYAERNYLKTDVKRGVTRNRAGTRIITLTCDFLIGLRNALEYECGKATDAVFKTSGKKFGKNFAKRTSKELGDFYGTAFDDFSMAHFEACLKESFSHHGWGKLSIDTSKHDKGLLIFTVENALYAGLLKKTETPADPLLAGVLAGFFSEISGEELDVVQTQCSACGAADSKFVVTLPSRLKNAENWVKNKQPHQQIVDLLEKTTA
jgi:uncharacterized protein